MVRIVVLDSGPLSNCVVPRAKPGESPSESQHCRQWLDDCERAGVQLLVPAISYYESLRELERRNATTKIARLRSFSYLVANRFIPIVTEHLDDAARFWGSARNSGRPTASLDSLDADMILVAQALSLGLPSSNYVVATTNPGHLSQFVPCDLWANITP